MFDNMPIMATSDLVKSLFNYLHLYHCFDFTFNFWKFHGVLGNGLIPSPKTVAQNQESLAQNYLDKSSIAGMPY